MIRRGGQERARKEAAAVGHKGAKKERGKRREKEIKRTRARGQKVPDDMREEMMTREQ